MAERTLAAVFHRSGDPLTLTDFALPQALPPGGALCRVLMATICGSDLHTIAGRRQEPAPLILGHEIVGEVVALGDDLTRDGFGDPLAVGDRVTWTIAAACGRCRNCQRGYPQKCLALRKYGHNCLHDGQPLTGGCAGHVVLWPGTTVFRLPGNLPIPAVAPANCALATAVHAVEAVDPQPGESVLILGAGLFGASLAALVRERGAAAVIVADVRAERLAQARRFGATATLDLGKLDLPAATECLRSLTDGHGPQVVFEVCGQPHLASWALDTLDIGGRLLVAGMVMPGTGFAVEGNQLTRRCLTVRGIHNYAPRHLAEALRFLARQDHARLFAESVGDVFPLVRIQDAIAAADSGDYLRVGVVPGC